MSRAVVTGVTRDTEVKKLAFSQLSSPLNKDYKLLEMSLKYDSGIDLDS